MQFDRWILRILPLALAGTILGLYFRHQSSRSPVPRPVSLESTALTPEEQEPRKLGYVGTADKGSWGRFIKPLSDRQQLGLQPGGADLGMMDIYADSSQQVRRARELLQEDSHKNGYRFWAPGKPNPFAGK